MTDPKQVPHKHAATIKAWADGARIEYKTLGDIWRDTSTPSWDENTQYRVKPLPAPTRAEALRSWNAYWGRSMDDGLEPSSHAMVLLRFIEAQP